MCNKKLNKYINASFCLSVSLSIPRKIQNICCCDYIVAIMYIVNKKVIIFKSDLKSLKLVFNFYHNLVLQINRVESYTRVARSDLIKCIFWQQFLTTIFDLLYGQTCYFIIKSDCKIMSLNFHLHVINELLLIFSILKKI